MSFHRNNHVLQFAAMLPVVLWWGGLTFYTAIVVPVGTKTLSATEQGFVTRSVSHWLNGLLAIVLVVLAWRFGSSRTPRRIFTWLLLLSTLGGLAICHAQLDRMLDPSTFSVSDPGRFYQIHRVYLCLTTVQWLAGVHCLWCLMFATVARSTKSTAENQ